MLFAPKAGSELRNQLSEQAGNLANTASEGYRKARSAGQKRRRRRRWADRGRDMYDKAKDAVNQGADEAQRYVRDAASSERPSTGRPPVVRPDRPVSSCGSGSSYGSGSSSQPGYSGPSSRARAPARAGAESVTSATARTVANVVLVSAGVAAAYVVVDDAAAAAPGDRAARTLARRQRAGVPARARDGAGLGGVRSGRA